MLFKNIMVYVVYILRIFIYPFIIGFRSPARTVVHNYMFKNNINFYGMNLKTPWKYNGYYYYRETNKRPIIQRIHKLSNVKFYLYFWLVWIWLDDNASSDIFYPEDMEVLFVKHNYLSFIASPVISAANQYDTSCYNRIGDKIYYGGKLTWKDRLLAFLSSTLHKEFNFAYYFFYKENPEDKHKYDLAETTINGGIYKVY